ncbi:HigA family addiction module antidote protein [Marinihelvus fidelis]|uniref:HigA family addiction module antidote protein n=1 Tax=Marinihelvus fidelis TaxID=2613842 RepID=A0A5N0T930_9GAMM|nr:HigA family addiction module antitoxin [Marinihelvus fidelis]KAA9131553.1 HigA family addiction module antidote protein [Marinihelvus fidelis]
MTRFRIPHSHPGKHLKRLMDEWSLTQYRLAKDIDVPQTRIMEIIRGKRAITADTAIRLSRYFNMTAEFWLNLQANYEIDQARTNVGQEAYQAIQMMPAIKARLDSDEHESLTEASAP